MGRQQPAPVAKLYQFVWHDAFRGSRRRPFPGLAIVRRKPKIHEWRLLPESFSRRLGITVADDSQASVAQAAYPRAVPFLQVPVVPAGQCQIPRGRPRMPEVIAGTPHDVAEVAGHMAVAFPIDDNEAPAWRQHHVRKALVYGRLITYSDSTDSHFSWVIGGPELQRSLATFREASFAAGAFIPVEGAFPT